MLIPKIYVRYCDLHKHDVVQVLSTQHGISEEMTVSEFEKIYLDEKQEKRLRYKEWYDIMSLEIEEAWPDMEWLLVAREGVVCQVVP